MELKYDKAMAAKLDAMRGELRMYEQAFSADALLRTGLVVGDVVKIPHSGVRYRVKEIISYHSRSGSSIPSCTVIGHRTYKTNRPDAIGTTYLSLSRVELVVERIDGLPSYSGEDAGTAAGFPPS